LQRVALQALAFSIPPAKLETLRSMFVKCDHDRSGTISLDEFKQAMSTCDALQEARVEELFRAVDVNGERSQHLAVLRGHLYNILHRRCTSPGFGSSRRFG
jgi:hypothetical protein